MSKKSPQLRFEGFTDDWEQRKLKDIVNRVTRKNKNLESTLPLTISAQYGLVDQITFFNKQIASKDMSGYYLLQKGEFAYNKSYSKDFPWGAIKRLNMYDEGVLSTLYIAFLPFKVNSDFLVSYYETDGWHKEVAIRAAEGARNHGLLNITAVDFFDTGLMIPPNNDEQQEIGGFFIELDHTITLHQRKLDLLKEQKKGFLQKMFPKNGAKVPELRFAGFADDWEERKLRDLLNKNSEKNKKLSVINVESVSNKTGFTKQTDQFEDYSVASADLSNYYVIREKQFAYNPSRINVGSIAYKDLGDEISVVSPLYVSFSTKKVLNDGFLWNWFKTASFDAQRQRLSEGGVRDTLSFNQLSEMNTMFPTYPEQEKIGSFFQQLDETIALHQRKLDLLKEQKKGFLQKMFV